MNGSGFCVTACNSHVLRAHIWEWHQDESDESAWRTAHIRGLSLSFSKCRGCAYQCNASNDLSFGVCVDKTVEGGFFIWKKKHPNGPNANSIVNFWVLTWTVASFLVKFGGRSSWLFSSPATTSSECWQMWCQDSFQCPNYWLTCKNYAKPAMGKASRSLLRAIPILQMLPRVSLNVKSTRLYCGKKGPRERGLQHSVGPHCRWAISCWKIVEASGRSRKR